MIEDEIRQFLTGHRDEKYRDFQSSLIPTADKAFFIGVRTPALREAAEEFGKRKDAEEFLRILPHAYFDENQVHAFMISDMKDYGSCVRHLNDFLPYVDNWATCDQMSPKVFSKHNKELLGEIDAWLSSGRTYTVRFGIKMLMQHFLDGDFKREYAVRVSEIKSDEYYVKMMISWYFATALAKQYESIIPFIENRVLETWTHNKTVQKALESFRIPDERKEYLRTLRVSSR